MDWGGQDFREGVWVLGHIWARTEPGIPSLAEIGTIRLSVGVIHRASRSYTMFGLDRSNLGPNTD